MALTPWLGLTERFLNLSNRNESKRDNLKKLGSNLVNQINSKVNF
jgi:hypothetical protein